ncbi:hypothetical protein C4F50_13960 [Flavobacterium sp. KB82]|uniref:Uncharacterized protein n=1 Tax=Flavobacterium hungaricum TaxID=2082725 RepID=A0ABR9TL48_9FLAO|nr:hypothetical protein [Flavobacterium hungaricum]
MFFVFINESVLGTSPLKEFLFWQEYNNKVIAPKMLNFAFILLLFKIYIIFIEAVFHRVKIYILKW